DHGSAHHAEVAGVDRNGDARHRPDQAVEGRSRRPLEERLALALAAHAVDHVEAAAGLLEHLRHDLGRILEIGVEHDDPVALGSIEPGGDRDLMPEVPRERDELVAALALAHRHEERARPVLRAVVDEHDLPRVPDGRQPPEELPETALELRNRLFLVVDGNDKGKAGTAHRGLASPAPTNPPVGRKAPWTRLDGFALAPRTDAPPIDRHGGSVND